MAISLTDPTRTPGRANDPWWIRTISVFGVPAAIAMYLVWSMTVGQATAMASINTALSDQKTALVEVATQTRETNNRAEAAVKDSQAATLRVESYLRLLCVNTARTVQDRNSCLSISSWSSR